MSNPKRIKLDNNITESFDYSQIDEAEMIQREADARDHSKSKWAGTMGSISDVYRNYYGYSYLNKPDIILEPPPLYIQCIIKLWKLGLKPDPNTFKGISPELTSIFELMKNVKITHG